MKLWEEFWKDCMNPAKCHWLHNFWLIVWWCFMIPMQVWLATKGYLWYLAFSLIGIYSIVANFGYLRDKIEALDGSGNEV